MSEENMIPKARFDEVISQRNELKTQLESLQQTVTGFTNEKSTLVKQIEDLQNSFNISKSEFEVDKTLIRSGISDESVIDFVKYQYGKQQDAPEFGSWLDGFKTKNEKLFGSNQTQIQQNTNIESVKAEPVTPVKVIPQVELIPQVEVTQQVKAPTKVVDQSMNGVVGGGNDKLLHSVAPHEISKLSPEQWKSMRGDILKSIAN